MSTAMPFEQYCPRNQSNRFDFKDIVNVLENSESFNQYMHVDIDDEGDEERLEVLNFLSNNGIEFQIFRDYVYGNLNYSAQHMAASAYPCDVEKLLKAFYEN